MRFLQFPIILALVTVGLLAGCTVPFPVTPVPVMVGTAEVVQSAPAQIAEAPVTATLAPPAPPVPVEAVESAADVGASQPVEAEQEGATNGEGVPCIVPDVRGLEQSTAENLIMGVGLRPVRAVVIDETIAAGSVVSQDPAAGTMMDPCEGYVTVIMSAVVPESPTNTPPATATPTDTPIPPSPMATSTPDPASLSFFDDFETGMNSAWSVLGSSPIVVNGKLVSDEPFEAYIGDASWTNYRLTLQGYRLGKWDNSEILVRIQDRDNYWALHCNEYYDWCFWKKVTNGEAKEIPGTHVGVNLGGSTFRIEVEGNIYRFFVGSEQKSYFVDDSISHGGIGLRHIEGVIEIESIEVTPLLE